MRLKATREAEPNCESNAIMPEAGGYGYHRGAVASAVRRRSLSTVRSLDGRRTDTKKVKNDKQADSKWKT
jgi:hypothetical protein